jgi:hypothetical protein
MSNFFKLLYLALILCTTSCAKAQPVAVSTPSPGPAAGIPKIQNPGRVVHVLVALCDNENQGIVPVSASLGNGQDPPKNLYWGAAFGVKTFFSKSQNWTKLTEISNPKDNVLERIVFKHKTQNVYLVADAYRGDKMRETIDDFFLAVSGAKRENVSAQNINLQILSGADLVAFVGHNGLMDFKLEKQPVKKDDIERDAIILACASRNYFLAPLRQTNTKPLLWTTNLMAPEAYILHDALEGWVKKESEEQIRTRGAAAYAKYQRIPEKAARNLLVTGW